MRSLKFKIAFALILILVWLCLKSFGLVGRELSDGINASDTFKITSINDKFEFELSPNKRGVYRYNVRLLYGAQDFPGRYDTQVVELEFTERLCDGSRKLGQANHLIQVKPGSESHKGLSRFGETIRAGINNRSKLVCIDVRVSDLSEPIIPNLKLKLVAMNTRPCWGLECLLD